MEELFRTIFEAFPEKSTITYNGMCSDCGNAVSMDIIPTSNGFGLLGGAFVECSKDRYVAKCPDCYKVTSKMLDCYSMNSKSIEPNKDKENSDLLSVLDRKNLLNSILATSLHTR